MSRLEAAAKAIYEHGCPTHEYPADEFDCCAVEAIKAADAHDRANGIHRIALSDATVERGLHHRKRTQRAPRRQPLQEAGMMSPFAVCLEMTR
jgi:hypothetical protein